MNYRSARFPAGNMDGLQQTWNAIDSVEASGVPVVSEVMAGASYRRQLAPETVDAFGNVDYLLQAILKAPTAARGKRLKAANYIAQAGEILTNMNLPGITSIDEGGIEGITGRNGDTNTGTLDIYAPWRVSKWTEAGRQCMVFVGVEPPQPQLAHERYPYEWSESRLKSGHVVFKPTPLNPPLELAEPVVETPAEPEQEPAPERTPEPRRPRTRRNAPIDDAVAESTRNTQQTLDDLSKLNLTATLMLLSYSYDRRHQ